MARLFVALDLPGAATDALGELELPALPGVRRTTPAQCHLTLHFLGEAEVRATAAALRQVQAPAFMLKLRGVGSFHSADGGAVLWVGAKLNEGLAGLHAAIARTLRSHGFVIERKSFRPHVTVARCEPAAAEAATEAYLTANVAVELPQIPAIGFGLYSSTPGSEARVYRREAWFHLAAPDQSVADC